MSWTSDWGISEKRAYAKGIEKGQRLSELSGESIRDKDARAALTGIIMQKGVCKLYPHTIAKRAYEIADAMAEARSKENNEEIPF